jgi:deoxyribonuclease I
MLAAGRTVSAPEAGLLPIRSAAPSMDSQVDLSVSSVGSKVDLPVGNSQTYYTEKLQDILDTNCSAGVCRLPSTPEGLEVSDETRDELHQIVAGIHLFFGKEGQRDVIVKRCPIVDGAKAMCYSHRALGYKTARKILFGKIHLKKELISTEQGKRTERYSVREVYCERDYYEDIGIGPDRYPSSGNVINTEHTWPQSRFRSLGLGLSRSYPRSDLHHLYPTDSERNSARGNHPFGEVGRVANRGTPSCTLSKLGYLSDSADGDFVYGGRLYFEPPDAHKGNVARALFYFSVRYSLPIGKTEESFLRKWHKEDPVDMAEKKRNQIIFGNQRNRNPFIDHPELADLIADF